MSGLSEVSVLIAQRTSDLEKAREIFTAETRAFVSGVLAGVRRVRSDPWTTGRVRLDLPRDIETEGKSTGYLSGQFAVARVNVRFKKGTNFNVVSELRFGIEFDETATTFAWQVVLVPASRYTRIDDLLWHQWRTATEANRPLGAAHLDKSNMVCFVSRPVGTDLTPEAAFNDVKQVLEFLLTADGALADAVGVELAPGEE